jgi:hypothetical protein
LPQKFWVQEQPTLKRKPSRRKQKAKNQRQLLPDKSFMPVRIKFAEGTQKFPVFQPKNQLSANKKCSEFRIYFGADLRIMLVDFTDSPEMEGLELIQAERNSGIRLVIYAQPNQAKSPVNCKLETDTGEETMAQVSGGLLPGIWNLQFNCPSSECNFRIIIPFS